MTKVAVFMMGGPASGKSRVRDIEYGHIERVLDCDIIKASHPDYDPKAPYLVHEWSTGELVKELYATLNDGVSFVYDGTGAATERYVKYIGMAHELGYTVILCYVKTTLAVALERNRKRERTVPEYILRDRYSLLATSFDIVSGYADEIRVVNN